MSIQRLLRANRTVLLMPVVDGPTEPLVVGVSGATCTFSAPTTAIINSWIAVTTTTATGAGNGGNISCALVDDLDLGLAASETDTELSICSIGNEVTPTFYNVDMTMNVFRDANVADTGVFNLATQLLNAKGIRYIVLDRNDTPSTIVAGVGDTISYYEAITDSPVDVKADRANLKITQAPKPTGLILSNYALLS